MTATPGSRPRLTSRPSPRVAVPHPSSDAARLRRLLDAQALITAGLPVPDALTRITHLACELTGARFGATAVAHAGSGVDLLVQVGEPRDIAAAATDSSVAVAGETTMCFLVVPVTITDEDAAGVVGEITLADTAGGQFSAADEEMVAALATVAATVLDNAGREAAARRHDEWANAAHEITRALLAEADVDMVLEVVSHALTLGEADLGMLALPDKDGRLRATVVVGAGAERFGNQVVDPDSSELARMLSTGQSVLCTDLTALTDPDFDNTDGFGPLMTAPLIDVHGVRGSVLLFRTAGRAPFTESDAAQLQMYADHVALALDMDDARSDAEWLRVLEVRHSIAQDLHDNVIQRLFATGMGLHSIDPTVLPDNLGQRLARCVSELDDTIDEIRERVFGLRNHDSARAESRFPRMRDEHGAGHRPAPGPQPTEAATRRPVPVPRPGG